jgi:transposase
VVLLLQEKIDQLTLQLQNAAPAEPPRGLGKMSSVIIDREIGNWHRFNNRRQIASYTGLCPGEHSSGNTRLQSCVTKHGNPRACALPWWNWPGEWSASNPATAQCTNGKSACKKASSLPAQHAKKLSSLWPDNWRSICGVCAPAGSPKSNWD